MCSGQGPREALATEEGKLRLDHRLLPWRHPPFLGGVVEDQEEKLQRGFVRRTMASGPHGPAQLGVQSEKSRR